MKQFTSRPGFTVTQDADYGEPTVNISVTRPDGPAMFSYRVERYEGANGEDLGRVLLVGRKTSVMQSDLPYAIAFMYAMGMACSDAFANSTPL